MRTGTIYILTIVLALTLTNLESSGKSKPTANSCSYFPVNNNITLVYQSSFGESLTQYLEDGELTISTSKGDKFKYKQSLIIKDDGVYVTEVYEHLNIFLFLKKDETYNYAEPLLRFPLPLSPSMEWKWEGDENCDNVTSKVKVTGKAIDKESVKTKAGTFDAIKLESTIEGSNSKNQVTEWFAEGIGLIKAKIVIEGGGMMGFMRDILGYGTIEFELKEIRKE
jgi:hypothetical protein